MARYIDADALESELFRDGIAGIFLNYPRRTKFTIGEIRGMLKNERIAPTADVVPKSKYDLAVAEREANVKGFAEDLDRLGKEVEKLTVELEAMRGAANSYKMHYENLAREIFEEIETVLCYSVYPRINANGTITPKRSDDFHIRRDDYNAIKAKYTEGAAADGDKR